MREINFDWKPVGLRKGSSSKDSTFRVGIARNRSLVFSHPPVKPLAVFTDTHKNDVYIKLVVDEKELKELIDFKTKDTTKISEKSFRGNTFTIFCSKTRQDFFDCNYEQGQKYAMKELKDNTYIVTRESVPFQGSGKSRDNKKDKKEVTKKNEGEQLSLLDKE